MNLSWNKNKPMDVENRFVVAKEQEIGEGMEWGWS